MVLDQFLYPYVDRVILDGGGCLKGIISLGDRMLVEAPAGLNRDFLGHETGLTVHIVEKRPDFFLLFRRRDEYFQRFPLGSPHGYCELGWKESARRMEGL